MWAGKDWNNVHNDVAKIADCNVHTHAHLEDMKRGIWEKKEKDLFEQWVRRKVVEPFLYMEPFSYPYFNLWAKEADLLPKESYISDGRADQKTRDSVILMDTVAYHLPWMMQFLQVLSNNCQQTRELVMQNKRKAGELQRCCLLDDVTKCVSQNDLYIIIRKYIPRDIYTDKMVTACFCITFVMWHQMVEQEWFHKLCDLGSPLSEEEEERKKMGNKEYKDGFYNQAVASYTMLIKNKPDNAIVYGNRAQAYLKLGKHDEAEMDGRRTIILVPMETKGYIRLAKAKEGLKQYHDGHLVTVFAQEVCSETASSWNQLYELTMHLKDLCQKEGACCKKTKVMHDIHIQKSSRIVQKNDNSETCNGTNNVPDLVSDSGSENESFQQFTNESSLEPSTVGDNPKSVRSKLFAFTLVELLKQLKGLQQQGTELLLSDKPKEAVDKYQQALDILPSLAEQNYEIEAYEKVCLLYALGIAHLNGPTEDLKNALDIFEDVVKNYQGLQFTAAHSALGHTFIKLYRFELAMEKLTSVLEAIKNDPFRTYTWPGTNTVIDNTIPEKHKMAVMNLIQQCQYPPNPEAICRYDNCLLPTKTIYFKAPDFKGFYRLFCETYCKMEYHPQCWKRVKDLFDRSQKGLIGQLCPTPDCGEHVTALEKYDEDGELIIRTETNDYKEKHKKERKTKLKKKKDIRKQPKLSECSKDEDLPVREDSPETTTINLSTADKPLEDPNNDSSDLKTSITPIYDVNTEPAYVLRKEDHLEDVGNKNQTPIVDKRKREKKVKKKQSTISVDEFCADALDQETGSERPYYNQYLERVRELQNMKNMVEDDNPNFWPPLNCNMVSLSTESPFYIPEHLRDDPESLERALRQNTSTAFAQQSPVDQKIKDTVYEYMEEFLLANGPMHKDSEQLIQEVNCFPGPTQALISESNGLVNFLKQSVRFFLSADILYATSQLKFGEKAVITKQARFLKTDKSEEVPLNKPKMSVTQSPRKVKVPSTPNLNVYKPESQPEDKKDLPVNIPTEHLNDTYQLSNKIDNTTTHGSSEKIDNLDVIVEIKHRSDSIDSNKSTSSLGSTSNTPSQLEARYSSQAFKSIKKIANSFADNLQVAIFQLQVSISALRVDEQQKVVCAVLNSCQANDQKDFWEKINLELAQVRILLKDQLKSDEFYKGQQAISECEQLRQLNSNLEERLCSTMDSFEKLKNSQTLSKKQYEEQIAELKTKNQKLQAGLNAAQTRLESEKQHLQQEKQKVKEESAQLKKEKEDEVKTARLLLTKVTDENKKLKSELDKERDAYNQFQENINILMENWEDLNLQARNAKMDLISLKKQEGMKNLEQELESTLKVRAQLLDSKKKELEKPTMSVSVFEVLLETPLKDSEAYLASLRDVKNAFLDLHDRHKSALESDLVPPEDVLQIPTLPKKPESLTSFIQTAMAASMIPSPYFASNYTNIMGSLGSMYRSPLLPNLDQRQSSSSPQHLNSTTMPQTNMSYPQFNTNNFKPPVSQAPQVPAMNSQNIFHPIVGMPYPTQQMFQNMNMQNKLFNGPPNVLFGNSVFPPSATSANNVTSQVNMNSFVGFPINQSSSSTKNEPDGVTQALGNSVQNMSGTSTVVTQAPVMKTPLSSLASSLIVNSGPKCDVSSVLVQNISNPKHVETVDMQPINPQSSNMTTNKQPVAMSHASLQSAPVMSTPNIQATLTRGAMLPPSIKDPSGLNTNKIASMTGKPIQFTVSAMALSKQEVNHLPATGPNHALPSTISVPPASIKNSDVPPAAAAPKSSYDKVIRKLQETYPKFTSSELEEYIQDFRKQRKGLTGMSIDKIVEGVSSIIVKSYKPDVHKARVITPVLVKDLRRPLSNSGLDIIEHNPLTLKGSSNDPWGASSFANSMNYAGSDDNTCSICLEAMTPASAIHETDCKHRFHYRCIQVWLKKNSKCPNCNSHTLLPQDYPPLGS